MASTSTTEIGDLILLDHLGVSHRFSSLFQSNDLSKQFQTLFIFIRHFFCGSCKEFVSALSQADGITPEELSAVHKRLIIIGCGQPTLIERYAKETKCSFPIYVDPTQKIYDALGMSRSLSLGEKKPDYIKSSFLGNIAKSAFSQLTAGKSMFQGGEIDLNGGEFLFDHDGKISWSHQMNNTRDHTEIKELRRVLTLDSK